MKLVIGFGLFFIGNLFAELPDIRTIEQDLFLPKVENVAPEAGKRVKLQLTEYKNTELYHLLYLPTNWQQGKKYPLIVEFAGNGPYESKYGDKSSGEVESSQLGYGLSAGKDFIWLCLPYVSKDKQQNQRKWWGDRQATIDYCIEAVFEVTQKYNGDAKNTVLCGFSRGSIACNYIGLANDEVAKLWSAFLCYSHYDGVRRWNYFESDKKSALKRFSRLNNRPQFIIMEDNWNRETKQFLKEHLEKPNLTFVDLEFRNHNSSWVMRKTKERVQARKWLKSVLNP